MGQPVCGPGGAAAGRLHPGMEGPGGSPGPGAALSNRLSIRRPIRGRPAAPIMVCMSISDYLVNAVLVLLVIRQIRGSKLDLVNLVLPLAITAVVGFQYLRSIPTAGNDLVLIGVLLSVGVLLGVGAAAATRLRIGPDGVPFAKAGVVAAVLWVVGIGFRMAFSFGAGHGAGPAIERFSVQHSITGNQAWVAALVLMALGEVVSRMLVLRIRGHRLTAAARHRAAIAAH